MGNCCPPGVTKYPAAFGAKRPCSREDRVNRPEMRGSTASKEAAHGQQRRSWEKNCGATCSPQKYNQTTDNQAGKLAKREILATYSPLAASFTPDVSRGGRIIGNVPQTFLEEKNAARRDQPHTRAKRSSFADTIMRVPSAVVHT